MEEPVEAEDATGHVPEHFARQGDAGHRLGTDEVVGGSGGVARHDEPAPDEELAEDSDLDDE